MTRRKTNAASAVGDAMLTSSSPEMRATEPAVASGINPASLTLPAEDAPRWTGATFTPEQRVAAHAAICDFISEGNSSRAACSKVGISRGTWRRWMEDGMVDRAQYARAREQCGDALAEGIIAIADDRLYDPQERRVMVDARKWVAARLFPKAWGERMDITSDGKSIGPIAALPASVLIQEDEHGV